MRRVAFIVTKPIQILVAFSLAEQIDALEPVTLIIVDDFHGAKDVFNETQASRCAAPNIRFEFVVSKRVAFKRVTDSEIECLFIDSDVGLQNYINLLWLKIFRRKLTINVFEEGIGTYRDDLYSGWRKKALDLIGAGTYFGGSAVADSIYVFDRSAYCEIFEKGSKKAKPINGTVMSHLEIHKRELARIFSYKAPESSGSKDCHVYLSSWKFSQQFLTDLNKLTGDVFVKPHPHIKSLPEWIHGTIISATVPSELVISDLSSRYSSVNVYHHGSSSEFYIREQNVNFVKIIDTPNG